MLRVGTAGWTIPTAYAQQASAGGSHLERYARIFRCAEINSSFYRSHRPATWQRWAASTPDDFRFSVKLPKAITHGAKLSVAPGTLDVFQDEIALLGQKLGPILIQLPPSLRFDECPAAEFFEALRDRIFGPVSLEPRNATWFTKDADDLLLHHRIARVAAHPARQPDPHPTQPPTPGGWPSLTYFRLHGAPRTYYSPYEAPFLASLAGTIAALPREADTWIIFDNTALGHAFQNALDLQRRIKPAY